VLTSLPILAPFDPKKETVLLTDASRLKGLGFTLLQNHGDEVLLWKLVQCGSHFLLDTETRYAVCELELLAVQWAMRQCHIYLAGLEHFRVITNHKPLLGIMNGTNLDAMENPRLQRLLEKTRAYHFTAEWHEGKTHLITDALSRAPVLDPEQVGREESDQVDLPSP
jgi:hypothetical protein